MKQLEKIIEELLSPIIKKNVSEAIRNENQKSKKSQPYPEIGGIELAMEITGLAKQTIYSLTHKGKIPFIKKGKRLYFYAAALIKWIEEGNTNSKTTKNEK